MIDDFARALGQIGDRRFLGVLAKALLLTLLVFAAIYAGVGWLISLVGPFTLPWIGVVDPALLLTGLAFGALALASVFLMIPVAAICVGFFLEDVAAAVEARHYPGLPAVTPQPILDQLSDALRFFLVLVFANLVGLILYVLAGPLAPLVFYGLNGFLLGREYFQLVAMRRRGLKGARTLRRQHFLHIWLVGTLMAVPLTIPILNLLIPVLGVATFTHVFHRVNQP
ncbi:MAG: EI24 domain-containing protein [Pseudomonadota bacterium]